MQKGITSDGGVLNPVTLGHAHNGFTSVTHGVERVTPRQMAVLPWSCHGVAIKPLGIPLIAYGSARSPPRQGQKMRVQLSKRFAVVETLGIGEGGVLL